MEEIKNNNYNKREPIISKKLIYAVIFIILILSSLFSGYYYGVWESTETNYDFSIENLVNKTPSFISSNVENSELFSQVWDTVKEKYAYGPVDDETLFYGALQGMVASIGDPHSIFLNPEETILFTKELNGSFEGIGAEIGFKDDILTIVSPLDNSPAYNAGLRSGDKILMIDEEETSNMSLDYAVSIIRGTKGTEVILTILSMENEEIKEVTVKRDEIVIESVTWEMLNNDIAYVKIVHFDSDTYQDFNKAVNEIILKNPNGVILDLRNNPGGYLSSAIDISGEFIEEDVIVIEDFGGVQEEHESQGKAKLKDYKTVVLVNEGIAS